MYLKDYCTIMLGNTAKRKVALGIYSREKPLKSHLLLKCLYWGRACVKGPEEKVGLRNRQRESMLRHCSCVGSRLPVYWSGMSKPGWSRNTGPLRAVALKQGKKYQEEKKTVRQHWWITVFLSMSVQSHALSYFSALWLHF